MRKQGKTAKQLTGRKERKEKPEVQREQRKATNEARKSTFGAQKMRTTEILKKHVQAKGTQRRAKTRKPNE